MAVAKQAIAFVSVFLRRIFTEEFFVYWTCFALVTAKTTDLVLILRVFYFFIAKFTAEELLFFLWLFQDVVIFLAVHLVELFELQRSFLLNL